MLSCDDDGLMLSWSCDGLMLSCDDGHVMV